MDDNAIASREIIGKIVSIPDLNDRKYDSIGWKETKIIYIPCIVDGKNERVAFTISLLKKIFAFLVENGNVEFVFDSKINGNAWYAIWVVMRPGEYHPADYENESAGINYSNFNKNSEW